MNRPSEIGLAELWRIIRLRRLFILIIAAAFGLAALAVNLASPRLYQSQSLVALPQVIKYSRDKDYTKVATTLMTTAETRALAEFFGRDGGADAALLGKLAGVSLDEVRGSNNYFRMTVTVRNDPQAAVALSQKIIGYLQERPAVTQGVDAERRELEDYLRQTDEAITGSRRGPGGGADGDRLRETRFLLQATLAQVHSYRFINEPALDPRPVGPRTGLSTALYALLGMMLGIAGALLQYLMARDQPGTL